MIGYHKLDVDAIIKLRFGSIKLVSHSAKSNVILVSAKNSLTCGMKGG